MEAEKSEGRIEKAVATCQRLNDRLGKCQKQIDKYKDTEVRSVEDVTNNVWEALDELERKLDTATKELVEFQYQTFYGNDQNSQLQGSKATLANWLTGVLSR
jgi:septation ring formation regulator EzrA